MSSISALYTPFSFVVGILYHVSGAVTNVAIRRLFVLLAVLIGLVIANLTLGSREPYQTKWAWIRARLLRSLIGFLTGLAASTAVVAISAIVHGADLGWLPASQQSISGFPVLHQVLFVTVHTQAAWTAAHIIVPYALIALLSGAVLAVMLKVASFRSQRIDRKRFAYLESENQLLWETLRTNGLVLPASKQRP